jgi:hypothetical protein
MECFGPNENVLRVYAVLSGQSDIRLYALPVDSHQRVEIVGQLEMSRSEHFDRYQSRRLEPQFLKLKK